MLRFLTISNLILIKSLKPFNSISKFNSYHSMKCSLNEINSNVNSNTITNNTNNTNNSILLHHSNNILEVILNRPKVLNALDFDMCQAIRNEILSWKLSNTSKDTIPYAFIMKGTGNKAFCAGGDVKSVYQEIIKTYPLGTSIPFDDIHFGSGRPGKLANDFFRVEYQMNYLLGTSPIPQISFWNGIVMGGGVGVSVLGEFRIATENVIFAMPESKIGLFPDVGSSGWLPHLKHGFGNYIGLTGIQLKACDVMYASIATHYIPSEKLSQVENDIKLAFINENASNARKVIKNLLKQYHIDILSDDNIMNQSILKINEESIAYCFDNVESIEQVYERLQELVSKGNEWAKQTIEVRMI